MNERDTHFDWGFGLQWLVVCAVGVVLGGAVAFFTIWGVGDVVSEAAGGLVAGALFGAFFGLGANVGPGLLLQRRGISAVRWIGYSAIAGALGVGIGLAIASSRLDTMSDLANAVFFGLVLGLPIGIGQWLILRRQAISANEWPLISGAAYLLAGSIIFTTGSEDTNMFLVLTAMALLIGAVTALGMVWLNRRKRAAAA